MLILVAGPSGVGKSRLIEEGCRSFGFETVLPVTTRPAREDEEPGHHYEFITIKAFQHGIRAGHFCCWDFVLGNYYGYRHDLELKARRDSRVIVQILARMALRAAAFLPDTHLLFLDSPDDRALESRILVRAGGTAELARRREHWTEERIHSQLFDITVEDAAAADPAALGQLLADLVARWE